MVKKIVKQSMVEFVATVDENINVEPHLDENIMEKDGFFRRAVTTAGLWKLVTAKPTEVLAQTVAQFLLNLSEGEIVSAITDPDSGELVSVNPHDVAGVFDLPRDGVDAFSKLELSVEVEYARFAAKRNAEWKHKGNNMRTDLEKPFNFICELYTKSVVCNIGTLGQVSDSKLFTVSAIVDSLTGTKFNWFDWFISNVQEVAKDFEHEVGSTTTIVHKGKLRFFGKLSYALNELFPGRKWPGTVEYKKTSVFNDLSKSGKVIIDRGILQKAVRPAVPMAERKGKAPKRAASPAKRAAPKKKKLKRVASLVMPSLEQEDPLEDSLLKTTEYMEARSQEGDEVDQPQPEASTTIPQAPQPQPQK